MNVCRYCGHEGELVWVHGHGQCARCGINVAPCCDGENFREGDQCRPEPA